MASLDPETRERFLAILRARLKPGRVQHVLGVTELILRIAAREGLDPAKAETAALLHDLCRGYSNAEMLVAAEKYGIPVDARAANHPMLLHGPVAAAEGQEMLGVEDAEVLEAVAVHTLGRGGMGRLAQALYVADYSEENRRYPEAAEARAVLEEAGLDAGLRFVAEQKAAVHKDGEDAAFLAWAREKAAQHG